MAARSRLAFAAIAFALAAGLSSWNPVAAPFGLVVGLAAALIAIRALQRGGRRWLASGALALSLAAVAVSAVVLALTAGVGREGGGAVVDAPRPADAQQQLDEAAERTRAARERARDALEKLGAPEK